MDGGGGRTGVRGREGVLEGEGEGGGRGWERGGG